MKITEIEVTPVKLNNGLVGFGSFVLEDCLYFGSVGLHTNLKTGGIRCVYPTKKLNNGKEMPTFHPINAEVSMEIEKSFNEKWASLMGGE